MVMADDANNGGANRALIGAAFAGHGITLGTSALLSPEGALAGASPRIDRRRGSAALQPATTRELRRQLGVDAGATMQVDFLRMNDQSVAKVKFRTPVELGAVDKSLRGVVAYVDVPVLVGESGGKAALLDTPPTGNPAEEVQDFVRALLAHDQLDVAAAAPARATRCCRRGAAARGHPHHRPARCPQGAAAVAGRLSTGLTPAAAVRSR